MTNGGAHRTVEGGVTRAPRGTTLSCKGWEQEAALRMLMNCADPEVSERPQALHDGDAFRATLAALRELEGDQTLLVRSGQPERVLRAQAKAPRVVIVTEGVAGPNEAAAASWLYVGTQTGLPTAYQAFAAAALEHFGGTLAGKLVMTGGMGTTGGPQPLAATLNGAAFLGVEADPEQIKRRVKSGYCEAMVNDLDEALRILKNSVRRREAASVGLIGNCAEVIPELARRGIVPDLLVDCTAAYGSLDSYTPSGLTAEQAREVQRADAESYRQRALDSIAVQTKGILELRRLGSLAFRLGGGNGERARESDVREVPEIPDFAMAYVRPLWSEGRTLLLWVALSGEPVDIARADRLALDVFSADEAAARWIRLAGKHVQFQGLPARVCLVDKALRASFGVALNDLVAQGAVKAPLAIGSVDFGGEAQTWPPAGTGVGLVNAAPGSTTLDARLAGLGARASAASWITIDSGERGNTRGSRLPLLAVIADGTAEMARRIERVLEDPAEGAARPADAGSAAATQVTDQATRRVTRGAHGKNPKA